jgi:hypothetical protein
MENLVNAQYAALRFVTIALCGIALGLYYGETLSNKKYESILKQYTEVGNQKIINCYEILFQRNKK